MTLTFAEMIEHFAEKLHALAPKDDVARGVVELYMNDVPVTIRALPEIQGMMYEAEMGFFMRRIPKEKLRILATQNFLGLQTDGNALCLEENGITLKLTRTLSSGASKAEYWDRLLHFLDAYVHLLKEYKRWPEFTPILNTGEDDQTGSIPNYHHIQG